MKIFISYSSQQRPVVAVLAQDLGDLIKTLHPGTDYEVWYDQELIGGHDWWDSILDSIQRCDLFIFALSAESLDSEACKLEIDYACQLNKRVLPVLITDDVDTGFLPPTLQRLQWIDYRQRDSRTAYQNLLKGMVNLPEAEPLPDPLPLRPDAPVSPLTKLMQQIDSSSLDLQLQAGLVHELKQYLDNPKQANQARQMLQKLSKHPDVRASIAREIDEVLQHHPSAPAAAPAPQPPPQERAAPRTEPIQAAAPRIVQPSKPQSSGLGRLGPYVLGIGAGLGIALLFSLVATPTIETFDPNWGWISIPDVEMICGYFVVFPLLGLGGGWLYARSRSQT